MILAWGLMLVPAMGQLQWSEKQASFEAKVLQKEIPVVFSCTNKGRKPVRIMAINSPCNCLHVHIGNEPIAVDEEKAITVIFSPRGRHGQQKLPFKIITDEGGRKEYSLQINGKVPASVVIEPSVFVWNKQENVNPRTAHIAVAKGVPLKIAEIYSMDENFLTSKVVNPEKGGFDVTITPQNSDVRRLGRVVVIAEDKTGKRHFHHMLMRVVDRKINEFVSDERKNALYWPEELAKLRGGKVPKQKQSPRAPDFEKLKKSLSKPLPVEGAPKVQKTPRSPKENKSTEAPKP